MAWRLASTRHGSRDARRAFGNRRTVPDQAATWAWLVWAVGRAREAPLAASIRSSGRRWNPLDIADSGAVDTVGFGLLTVGMTTLTEGSSHRRAGLAR